MHNNKILCVSRFTEKSVNHMYARQLRRKSDVSYLQDNERLSKKKKRRRKESSESSDYSAGSEEDSSEDISDNHESEDEGAAKKRRRRSKKRQSSGKGDYTVFLSFYSVSIIEPIILLRDKILVFVLLMMLLKTSNKTGKKLIQECTRAWIGSRRIQIVASRRMTCLPPFLHSPD